MALDYIDPDASPTASEWNAFYQEFDRKLTLILDGKSPLIENNRNGWGPFCGRLFFFTSAGHFLSDFWGDATNYDHSIFQPSVDSAEVYSYDAGLNIITVQTSGFPFGFSLDNSLEAIRRNYNPGTGIVSAWVRPLLGSQSEKIHRYALAEIVIEGPTSITFPDNYNKFNFFRVHNLGSSDAVLDFGGHYSLSIPKFSCRTVRRDSVTDGYQEGWNYFFKFKSGDPRLFLTNSALGMNGNNISYPAMAHALIDSLVGGAFASAGIKVVSDIYKYHDESETYSGYFGDNQDSTIYGDMLYHKGKLLDARTQGGTTTFTEVNFTGCANLVADFATAGITATTDPITFIHTESGASHDLINLSTNLVDTLNIYDLGSSLFFGTQYPVFLQPYVKIQFNALNGSPNAPLIYKSERGSLTAADASNCPECSTTIGQLKNFPDTMIAGSTNPVLSSYADQQTFLTGNGFNLVHTLSTTINLTFGGYVSKDDSAYNDHIGRNELIETDDGHGNVTVVLKESFQFTFTAHHWPVGSPYSFLSPRDARRYVEMNAPSATQSGYSHPAFDFIPNGPDGEDFKGKKVSSRKQDELRSLRSVSYGLLNPDIALQPDDDTVFLGLPNPDVLDEILLHKDEPGWYATNRLRLLSGTINEKHRIVRLPLLSDWFNFLVSRLNSMVKAFPLTIQNSFGPFFTETSIQGVYGGPYFPSDCFYGSLESANLDTISKWGIALKSFADLPQIAAVRSADAKIFAFPDKYLAVPDGTDTLIPNTFDAFWHPQNAFNYNLGALTDLQHVPFFSQPNSWVHFLFLAPGPNYDDVYSWVRITDVQAAAQVFGFRFDYERAVYPCNLILVPKPDDVNSDTLGFLYNTPEMQMGVSSGAWARAYDGTHLADFAYPGFESQYVQYVKWQSSATFSSTVVALDSQLNNNGQTFQPTPTAIAYSGDTLITSPKSGVMADLFYYKRAPIDLES